MNRVARRPRPAARRAAGPVGSGSWALRDTGRSRRSANNAYSAKWLRASPWRDTASRDVARRALAGSAPNVQVNPELDAGFT